MHKQRILIFLCVCVCVCVCVSATLSVNSPTGQTPQRIFTVDSLKDADLRKGVPFGGRRRRRRRRHRVVVEDRSVAPV